MGNLYTHIETAHNNRLEKLGKLRLLWENYRATSQPKFKKQILQEINEISKTLQPYKSRKQLLTYSDYQREYGSFAWKAWEQRKSG